MSKENQKTNKHESAFILYAGEDEATKILKDEICLLLKYIGISYADYKDKNTTPQETISKLNTAIENSSKIIMILSETYFTNVEFCQNEIFLIMNSCTLEGLRDRIFPICTPRLEIYQEDIRIQLKNNAEKAINEYLENQLKNAVEIQKIEVESYKLTNGRFIEYLADARGLVLPDALSCVKKLEKVIIPKNDSKVVTTSSTKPSTSIRIYNRVHELGYHFIIVTDVGTLKPNEDIKRDINEGNFNQMYLYFSTEAVETWESFVNYGSTRIQREYIEEDIKTLDSFLDSDYWKKNICGIDRVIDLGVGTGEKTMEILKSFNKGLSKTINFVIVDTSLNMIKNAFKKIQKQQRRYFREINYTLDGLNADFMHFSGSEKCFVQGNDTIDLDNRSAFFILGGTLCNVSISDFLTSLQNICIIGDYLIVGVHTLDNDDNRAESEIEEEILHTYDLEKLKKIFSASLREINLELKHLSQDFETDVNQNKILNFKAKLNDSDNIISDKDKTHTLIASTRYTIKNIKDIMKNDNFEFKKAIHSSSKKIAYIAFEYTGKKE